MARARNIKPAFFTNDELADNDPLGRILFIGMWTIADFKGDLVWRPKRVKAQLLPYDSCDISKLAINLDRSGFIRFYSDGNEMYCRVLSFTVHQNPHKNERDKGSDIPGYSEEMRQLVDLDGLTINLDKSGSIRNDSASDPADPLILNPDPLILNPDCVIPVSVDKPTPVQRKRFTPPIKNEVYGYMVERGLNSNQAQTESEKFMDHYLSNGWKVGRNAMKDWKAAVRNWTKGKDYGSHQQASTQRGQIDHDDTSWITGTDDRAEGGDRTSDQRSLQRIDGNLPSMETGVLIDHEPRGCQNPVDEGADGSWPF
jgi:hypothetical protein